ncbi:aminotransferase class IV [Acetobacterium woodii]|uniref:Aminodeoxychorismate lyase PabC1 n=1 Tax=Acetobacterium woodii (strain ATCC 29683 / DSM 1030 / JCM 2381 / KCTC 1655 / WB1) TaxID=931626 RepID=H6LJ43_ACEWD|nr:aminotransferase class IV [Acetobacterium woodii]AFA47406.1 aminodeoxychorismate lyase PabC1 [Acetobacterium woodii DSM 1030]
MDYVSYNRELLKDCQVPLDQGFLYGYGLFETINVVKEKPLFFDEHMTRLKNSAVTIGLKLEMSLDQLYTDCCKNIEINQIDRGALRITLSKGINTDNLLITARENHYNRALFAKGLKICTNNYVRNEKALLVGIKSNNYLENLLILNEAKSKGFNESIFHNTQGHLAEGCMTNIFFVKNNVVYTPAADCGLLAGIVRNKVIALLKQNGLAVETGYYPKEQWREAEEVFITNSLMEIMPVSQVDDHDYPVGEKTLTAQLDQLYQKWYNQ